MADVSDCANALEDIIAALAAADDAGWVIHRGEPEADALDAAMEEEQVVVSIMPRVGMVRNTTRYLEREQPLPAPPSTLSITVAGSTVTFAGTGQIGAAGVLFGTSAYSTRTTAADAAADVAGRLAGLIPGASVAGPALTIPTNQPVAARIAVDTATLRIMRNTEQQFAVTVWCADPGTRDTVAALVDMTLCSLTFLPLADGSVGRLRFANDTTSDKAQSASIYTRQLSYGVDYPTTARMVRPAVLFPQLGLTLNASA